jgi:hypothetical protein
VTSKAVRLLCGMWVVATPFFVSECTRSTPEDAETIAGPKDAARSDAQATRSDAQATRSDAQATRSGDQDARAQPKDARSDGRHAEAEASHSASSFTGACMIRDAGRGFYSNRDLVVCAEPGGGTSNCLSATLECSGTAKGSVCTDACASDEYGQLSTNISTGHPYPSGCHAAPDSVDISAGSYMCCKCSG